MERGWALWALRHHLYAAEYHQHWRLGRARPLQLVGRWLGSSADSRRWDRRLGRATQLEQPTARSSAIRPIPSGKIPQPRICHTLCTACTGRRAAYDDAVVEWEGCRSICLSVFPWDAARAWSVPIGLTREQLSTALAAGRVVMG